MIINWKYRITQPLEWAMWTCMAKRMTFSLRIPLNTWYQDLRMTLSRVDVRVVCCTDRRTFAQNGNSSRRGDRQNVLRWCHWSCRHSLHIRGSYRTDWRIWCGYGKRLGDFRCVSPMRMSGINSAFACVMHSRGIKRWHSTVMTQCFLFGVPFFMAAMCGARISVCLRAYVNWYHLCVRYIW